VPKDPAALRCPDGMAKLKKKVDVTLADGSKVQDWEVTCIDRFEFPGAGAVPRTGVDLGGARSACVAKGKRLCTRSEWRRACGGAYPYGKDYDAERCNTAGEGGIQRALVAAGSKRGCVSPVGAYDMVGNAAEWTSDGTVNGGTSLKNAEDATCGSGSKRAGGAPHIGFRCCADAKP
jgi:formylglycine-generating enzyme required for sulfatase activity